MDELLRSLLTPKALEILQRKERGEEVVFSPEEMGQGMYGWVRAKAERVFLSRKGLVVDLGSRPMIFKDTDAKANSWISPGDVFEVFAFSSGKWLAAYGPARPLEFSEERTVGEVDEILVRRKVAYLWVEGQKFTCFEDLDFFRLVLPGDSISLSNLRGSVYGRGSAAALKKPGEVKEGIPELLGEEVRLGGFTGDLRYLLALTGLGASPLARDLLRLRLLSEGKVLVREGRIVGLPSLSLLTTFGGDFFPSKRP